MDGGTYMCMLERVAGGEYMPNKARSSEALKTAQLACEGKEKERDVVK